MKIPWANLVTLVRILLIPPLIATLIYHQWGWVLTLILLTGLTDALDGFVARSLQQETLLGSYLDPLADKLLLLGTYGTLWYIQQSDSFLLTTIPAWFIGMIIVRELVLIIASGWLAQQYRIVQRMQPTRCGKLATLCHFILLATLCVAIISPQLPLHPLLQALIYGTTLCMIISAVQYGLFALKYARC